MRTRVSLLIVVVLLSSFASTRGADTPTTDEQRISALIMQLGDASAQKRDDAAIALLAEYPTAFPVMEASAKQEDQNAEIRTRLQSLLSRTRPWVEARARLEKSKEAELSWQFFKAISAYGKNGTADPKWDDDAKKGIRLMIEGDASGARALLQKAADSGCTDPMASFMLGKALERTGGDREAAGRFFKIAFQGMQKPGFPVYFRLWAAVRGYQDIWTASSYKLHAAHAEHFDQETIIDLNAFEKYAHPAWNIIERDKVPPRLMRDLAMRYLDMGLSNMQQGNDRKERFDQLVARMEKWYPDNPASLVLTGSFYIDYAWDARGTGFANTVTAQGAQLMRERLLQAEKALTKAWQMDSSDPKPASLMIVVAMGLSRERDFMEKWFGRAIAADPDFDEPYLGKLAYLEPKWLGSAKELLQFGRQCFSEGNWYAGHPFILPLAHQRLAEHDENYPKTNAFWADVQRVYQPWLRVRPNDNQKRSRYCYFACESEHWDIARALFEALGTKAEASQFDDAKQMETFREKAMAIGKPSAKP